MNYINDNEMTYDLNLHRYVLTEDYFNEYHNLNLTQLLSNGTDVNTDAVSKVFLKRVSNVFYNYILSSTRDVQKALYMFSKEEYREAIKEGMLELGYSFIINNKDNSIMLDSIDKKSVPSGVETICLNNGLFNRMFMKLPHDWKETKGVDW